MTREEAIKALERAEDYAGIQCVNNCVDAYISPYLLKAIDFAISALREQEQRRWIPVKERLPEDGEKVLTQKNGIIEVQRYEKKRNGWISGNWFWSMATVSHWMPLPEPPKGE